MRYSCRHNKGDIDEVNHEGETKAKKSENKWMETEAEGRREGQRDQDRRKVRQNILSYQSCHTLLRLMFVVVVVAVMIMVLMLLSFYCLLLLMCCDSWLTLSTCHNAWSVRTFTGTK